MSVEELIGKVRHELHRAQTIHPRMNGPHEAYAVILEELDEYWDEVKKKKPDREKMRTELIQAAAMCLRAVLDTTN